MDKIKFIKAIRELIADGKTDEALALMRAHVGDFDPSLVTDAVMLESRYNSAASDFTIKSILPREDYDRTIAQINFALLETLEKIEKSAPLSIGTPKNKNSGRILHNIPGTMPIGKERRCIVRIAYDDETLLRDLKADENTVIQSVRISEVMAVELVDFNETPAFSIRTMTGQEQFLSEEDFTQWIFMVKALREGKFPLTLKVAVIEEVNGKERKRDIVLEKEVFVISNIEEPAAAAPSPATTRDVPQQPSVTHFEDSSIRFNYVTTEDEAAVATTAKKRFSISGIMSTVGVIVMAMVGFVTFKSFNPWREGGNPTGSGQQVPSKGGSQQGNSSSSGSSDTSTKLLETPINQGVPPDELAQNGGKKEDKTNGEASTPNPNVPKIEKKPDIIANVPAPPPNTSDNKAKPAKNAKPPILMTKPKAPKPKIKVKPMASDPIQTTVTEQPNTTIIPTQTEVKPEKEAEVKTFRVRLVLKGQMKKAEISVDGQSVDKFLKRSIWGTPQYIEFKSSKIRHSITFKRGNVSCTVTDILIENDELSVEPCSFE